MDQEIVDRIIVHRLMIEPPEQYPQHPFHYLLGCFSRAAQELRAGPPAQLQSALDMCKQLLVSYAVLILTRDGLVPEVGWRCWHSKHGEQCCIVADVLGQPLGDILLA